MVFFAKNRSIVNSISKLKVFSKAKDRQFDVTVKDNWFALKNFEKK